MASISHLIANLGTLTFDASWETPAPSLSSRSVTGNRFQVGNEPALRFRFSALNSKLPLVQRKDLQNRKYIAQGACSQVTAATFRAETVAVKRIIRTTYLQHEESERHQMILDKISGLQQDLEVCLHPELKRSGYFSELLGYGTEDDLPFLVMEYAECGSLLRMLYTDQTWATRRSIINDIAIGLEALHTNGFTHGDVKLENVLVFRATDGKPVAKLSDFSLATLPSSRAERESVYYGSWPWIPIECWKDERVTSLESCDIWTFAFALWRVADYRTDDSMDMLDFVPKQTQHTPESNLGDLSLFQIIHDRGSWQAQRDVFNYIRNMRDDEDSEIQNHTVKELLVAICQVSGFGCLKDVAPFKRLFDQDSQESPEANPRQDGMMSPDEAQKTLLSRFEVLLGEAAVALEERGGFSDGDVTVVAEIKDLTNHFTSLKLEAFHSNMLWSACRNGFAVAAMYLSSYFDPNERDLDCGSTPLHFLFKIPEPYMDQVAETLVACGADPDLSTNKEIPYKDQESHLILEGTPLDWSIKAGSKRAVQCLLAVGADPLVIGMSMTPLCRAVSLYRSDIIRCIMDRIGPIEKLMTADMVLCEVGFEIVYGFGPQLSAECERALLYGDHIKNAAEKALDTVLEYMREDTSHFLDILLFQTLTPEAQYTTAVPVPYLTELFIEKGAHVIFCLAAKSRPMLHRLAELWIRDGDNCETLLESLLLRFPDKFDLNVRDSGGRTALHEAAIYNSYPLIPILLRHGADIDAEDMDHCTPLALAGCMASVQAFELLLDNGAIIQLKDGNVLLQCGANPRAAFNIPGWGVVISIREDATLLRHRPELSEPTYTWQRKEWVGQDQRVADIRKIQKMLYRNCKESDYEEPDMMHIPSGGDEWYTEEFRRRACGTSDDDAGA
ncbi:hypothetical protein FAVG1_04813 [Fusarium avenaceum]|nr:hypothetical protein FAVG1_04813 [Fusarium avenaceum]